MGIAPLSDTAFADVEKEIEIAPPVAFDVARQVRIFKSYLQYVEITLTGAAMERHRVRIPKSLLNLGPAKDLEGRLNTTFNLIKKRGPLSSEHLEKELAAIRDSFTRSLGKKTRVVLIKVKPLLDARILDLRGKLRAHQKHVKLELQSEIDTSKRDVAEYYLPLVKENPPDAMLGSLLSPDDPSAVRCWIMRELSRAFPCVETLVKKMILDVTYKDLTFETLDADGFLDVLNRVYPEIPWDRPYDEFKAAEERAPNA